MISSHPDHQPHPALAALDVQDLCIVTLWGECRNEPIEGQIAVANVLRNRVEDGRWGKSYRDVILHWAQFSCLWPTLGGINFNKVLAFIRRLSDRTNLSLTEQQLVWIVDGLHDGTFVDNTASATHYFADYITPPKWAAPPAYRTVTIGRHHFWRNVR